MQTFILLLIASFTFTHSSIFSQWVYQQTPANASYYLTIDFPNTQLGIAGGVFLNSGFFGRGAYTTNGGTNWQASMVPDSCRVIVDIEFIDNSTGYCTGAYNTILMNYPVDPSKYDKRTLRTIGTVNSFAVDNYKGLFMRSTNSGQSWQPYGVLPSNVYYLLGMDFVNNVTGYAAASYNYSGGVNDGVIKTTNAGLTWTALIMPENINSVTDVFFQNINTGFAIGFDVVNDTARGVILKTTNAGNSWNRQVFMQIKDFSGISFSNASTGLVVSISNPIIQQATGSIYKTTNAGANWSLINRFYDVDVHGVSFVTGSGTAFIYGTKYFSTFEYKEFIAKTTNYGNNWIEGTFNDTGLILIGSKLIDQNKWYFTGGDFSANNIPVILHTGNGAPIGIEPIGNEIPKNYSLSQNYPNPFNPVTKIRFAIPPLNLPLSGGDGEGVLLKIYDLLGREVETLVNEQLSPGTYEVDFDASKFTSGVYFYKLTTDKFTETKRMLLVK